MSSGLCRVNVDYFGAIAGIVRKRKEEVVLPAEDASVKKLLAVLSLAYGSKFEDLVTRQENTSPVVTIFVNGECLTSAEEASKLLVDGSEVDVSLVNQMSGG